MAEVELRDRAQGAVAKQARAAKSAARDLVEGLRTQLDKVNDRIDNPAAKKFPCLGEELRDDANYVVRRVRYFHEYRPLNAVGLVAGTAFALGLAIGLWRD